MIPAGRDPRLQKRLNEIRERDGELHDWWCNRATQRTKDYPPVSNVSKNVLERNLLVAVYEERALNQMYKHREKMLEIKRAIKTIEDSFTSKEDMTKKEEQLLEERRQQLDYLNSKLDHRINMFWESQKRFIQAEYMSYGDICGISWFLENNSEYASKYRGIKQEKLNEIRDKNANDYNNLVTFMQEHAPRYDSTDSISMPI